MWQGKVLAAANGRNMLAVTSMLAHAYPDAIETLLRVIQPLCWDDGRGSLRAPFLSSIAKVDKAGRIVADAVMRDALVGEMNFRDRVLYVSLQDFQNEMRRIADRVKLGDDDRKQFFIVARNWIAADRRLDPNMDPRDPDAKRLVAN